MIEIRRISKTYHKQEVLKSVSLHISRGHVFALLGPNGSGKTTLMKSLLGVVHPDRSAEILFGGKSTTEEKNYKERVGYMSQTPKFPPHLKVRELIALLEKLRRKEGVYKEALITELKIAPFWNKALGELSGGMAQKVNIVQCFMYDHEVMILDEPTSGLDPQAAYDLRHLILKRKNKGRTIVLSSHVMSEVEELADEVAFLVSGKLYTVATPHMLKQEYRAASLEQALRQLWDRAVYE